MLPDATRRPFPNQMGVSLQFNDTRLLSFNRPSARCYHVTYSGYLGKVSGTNSAIFFLDFEKEKPLSNKQVQQSSCTLQQRHLDMGAAMFADCLLPTISHAMTSRNRSIVHHETKNEDPGGSRGHSWCTYSKGSAFYPRRIVRKIQTFLWFCIGRCVTDQHASR